MNLETIYIVHHTHTDIGFTHDQPILWEMQRRFIDMAVDAAERDLDRQTPDAFRWTCETTAAVMRWFETATDRQIERFQQVEKAGRIEVMGQYLNNCPLMDLDETIESLRVVHRLRREYGLTIRYAMNNDVNGQNWPTVDALLDAGIEAFQMGLNEHFGGAPFIRPNIFHWVAPSGRKLLTLNGSHYNLGNWLDVGGSIEKLRDESLAKFHAYLERAAWKLPFALLQYTHAYGDNGPGDNALPEFIRTWNKSVGSPKLELVTPKQFWAAVEPYANDFPTFSGDWTDYWNFGAGSAALEMAVARQTRARLNNADQLYAFLGAMGVYPGTDDPRVEADVPGRSARNVLATAPSHRTAAWRNLLDWQEHTWGADCQVSRPQSEDTHAQWHHKSKLAWEARALSLMLQRDALGELALLVERETDDAMLIFNPLPWKRTVGGALPKHALTVRGTGDDPSSSRHSQDRLYISNLRLIPTELPPLGYAVVKKDAIATVLPDAQWEESATIEDQHRRLVFDRSVGGLVSWFDKKLGRELVSRTSNSKMGPLPFGTIIYEAMARPNQPEPRRRFCDIGWNIDEHRPQWHSDWTAFRAAPRLIGHRVYRYADSTEIVQTLILENPSPEGGRSPLASEITLRFILRPHSPALEIVAEYVMGQNTAPESTYMALPFAVGDCTTRIDVGHPIRPDVDQLPGVCRDYFTVQRYVNFSRGDFGVTVAMPENPLVQIGDFHFADFQKRLTPPPAVLLGWITNNYWDTNFRASQAGIVRGRYVIWPHAGGFDESTTLRFAAEASAPLLTQTLQEPPRPAARLPRAGSLLQFPQPPVVLLHALPAWAEGLADQGRITLRLYNASDTAQAARIASGVLKIASGELMASGTAQRLDVRQGSVELSIAARRVVTVGLRCSA